MAFPVIAPGYFVGSRAHARHGGATREALSSRAAMEEGVRRRVLIVDDMRLLRELVRDALRHRFPGLEVIEAGNVADGYRYARKWRPGLVLLDIRLPDGSGLELARQIHEELPEIVVCICTNHDSLEYRQAAAEAGATHFISKEDRFWSDTENLVRTELGFTDSDLCEPGGKLKSRP